MAGGGVHSIRVFGNRGVNAAHAGLSGQPIFGGPAYYYRNVMYHIQVGPPFKFNARSAGDLAYHNTAIADLRVADPFSNAHPRNNLFLGADRQGQSILSVANCTAYSSHDYNGYRPNRGVSANYLWASPASGMLRDDALNMAEHGRKLVRLAQRQVRFPGAIFGSADRIADDRRLRGPARPEPGEPGEASQRRCDPS